MGERAIDGNLDRGWPDARTALVRRMWEDERFRQHLVLQMADVLYVAFQCNRNLFPEMSDDRMAAHNAELYLRWLSEPQESVEIRTVKRRAPFNHGNLYNWEKRDKGREEEAGGDG